MFDFMLQECVFSISLSDSLNIKSNIKPKFYGECLHPLIRRSSRHKALQLVATQGTYGTILEWQIFPQLSLKFTS